MNSKAIFILLFSLVLSACQHTSPPNSDTTATATVPSGETSPQSRPTESKKPTTIYNTTPASPLYSTNNVIDRIRNGFRFPDLDSKYIAEYEKWNSTHPTYLTNLFKRSEPFLFHIVEEIEKRGLPMELALLPAIESAYKPNAISRSKAGGLWQFIPSTGRSFGLTQDWWFDGRRDVLLSTNAALDYLTQLNKLFDGDWFLTLAAYNAGQGTVGKAIRKNRRKGKRTSYEHLSLRSETRRYVPKLIALKKIINSPEAYGVIAPVINNRPYFTVLPIDGQINLRDFAKEVSIDYDTLHNINAGFLRWATAPNSPQRLLIPVGDTTYLETARIAAKKTIQVDYQRHTIARGDTLSGIARRHGVSVSALKSTNKLKSNSIRAGKTLLIPNGGNTVATRGSEKQTHQVKRGDTLWGIARQYKVRVDELVAWNQLSKNEILKLNQSLVLFP